MLPIIQLFQTFGQYKGVTKPGTILCVFPHRETNDLAAFWFDPERGQVYLSRFLPATTAPKEVVRLMLSEYSGFMLDGWCKGIHQYEYFLGSCKFKATFLPTGSEYRIVERPFDQPFPTGHRLDVE